MRVRICNFNMFYCVLCGGSVGWGTALLGGRSRVRFSPDIILRSDSTANRNEHHEYFRGGGGKDGRWVGLINSPPSLSDRLEIWEPSRGLLYFTFASITQRRSCCMNVNEGVGRFDLWNTVPCGCVLPCTHCAPRRMAQCMKIMITLSSVIMV